jgi:hypothetical protein
MSMEQLADELAAILTRPTDIPGLKGRNPKRLATSQIGVALNPNRDAESANFEQPIEVVDLRGPLQLFRMFDWRRGDIWVIGGLKTTCLSRWWL